MTASGDRDAGGSPSLGHAVHEPALRSGSPPDALESGRARTHVDHSSADVVELRGVSVRLGHEPILAGVDLKVTRGELVGIAGPNGGGKTTMLRAILGLVPAQGSIRLFGVDHREFRERRRIGYVAQNAAHVDPSFPATAEEVVLLGRVAPRGLLRRLTRADRDVARQAMREVGIESLRSRPIGAMSGGQRQRVLLARALASQPDLLLLDEPTTGVDPGARDEFLALLAHLNAEHHLTMVIVSHDNDTLTHLARRLVVVDRAIVHDAPMTPDTPLPAGLHLHDPMRQVP